MTNEQIECTLKHLIGTQYTAALKAYITETTGRARVVGPNEITTREYDLQRVNVRADSHNVITGFSFG